MDAEDGPASLARKTSVDHSATLLACCYLELQPQAKHASSELRSACLADWTARAGGVEVRALGSQTPGGLEAHLVFELVAVEVGESDHVNEELHFEFEEMYLAFQRLVVSFENRVLSLELGALPS